MQKMAIIGICGKMGKQIASFYQNQFDIVGVDMIKHPVFPTYQTIKDIQDIDVIVDFSSPDCYKELKEGILARIPVLSGTTGYELDQIEALEKLASEHDTPFIWRANYAKGIQLFTKLIEDAQQEFNQLDFVEIHATSKKDAPSGTAKVLAKQLKIPEDKIQSLRINYAPAIHEIIFSSEDERVILRHEIIHKKAFILGFDEELKRVVRN